MIPFNKLSGVPADLAIVPKDAPINIKQSPEDIKIGELVNKQASVRQQIGMLRNSEASVSLKNDLLAEISKLDAQITTLKDEKFDATIQDSGAGRRGLGRALF